MSNQPNIMQPTYSLTLPSNGKELTYRPYLVKENRIMMMANESNDETEIARAVAQVINNCVIEPVTVNDLAEFDVDWIFIHLKAAAAGDTTSVEYVCSNVPDPAKLGGDDQPIKCLHRFNIAFATQDIEIKNPVSDIKEITLNGQWAVQMRYPRFGLTRTLKTTDTDYERTLKTVAGSIEYLVEKGAEKPIYAKDLGGEEIMKILDSLTPKQLAPLEKFLDTVPYYEITKKHKCEKCGFEHVMVVNNLTSFFE